MIRFAVAGVTLLQSGVKGYESIGFDINPIALLIAKAKIQFYQRDLLLSEFNDLKERILKNPQVDIPEIKNRDYWYLKSVSNDLGRIRYVLKNSSYKYKDFFLVSFAFICRDQSLTRNGEFKRYRINNEKIGNSKNDVFPKYFIHLSEMMRIFLNSDIPTKLSKPLFANSENNIPQNMKYDLTITSPPYGDSRTTVAYGQYTSFGAEWINGLDCHETNGYRVDAECLGKKSGISPGLNKNKILINVIDKIKNIDSDRSDDVLIFLMAIIKPLKT